MTGKLSTTLVAALLVLATVAGAAAPAAAAGSSSDVFDKMTLSHAGAWSFNDTDVAAHHGEPSWIVHVEDGKLGSLEQWAGEESNRHVIATYNDSNRALISAPAKAVGVRDIDRLLNNGLATRSYVESIRLNVYVSNVESVTLQNQSAIPSPTEDIWAADWRADGAYSPEGIAFQKDAQEATVKQIRKATDSTQVSATGENITIAVVDTGVNTAGGRLFGNGSRGSNIRISNASASFLGDGITTVNESGYDAVGSTALHGTHVASIIAANASGTTYDGFAPDATILALQALSSDGSGSTADIAQAVRYAADHDADIISLSLGSAVYNQELAAAVMEAVASGAIVVVAAGNSRQTTRWVATPADVPSEGVITVAATNYSSNVSKIAVGYFSQLGHDPGTTDLSGGATAGQDITVSSIGMKVTAKVADTSDTLSNLTLTGTSMAAPTVSGSLAQALDAHPTWQENPNETVTKLEKSAVPLPKAAKAEAGEGFLAVDRLVNTNYPDKSQEEAMNKPAQQREEFWTWLSNSQGGFLQTLQVGTMEVGA